MADIIEANKVEIKGGKVTFTDIRPSYDEGSKAWIANWMFDFGGEIEDEEALGIYLEKLIINQREKDIVVSYWTDSLSVKGRMSVPGTLKKVPPEDLFDAIMSKATDGSIDYFGIDIMDLLPAKTQFLHGRWPKIFSNDI